MSSLHVKRKTLWVACIPLVLWLQCLFCYYPCCPGGVSSEMLGHEPQGLDGERGGLLSAVDGLKLSVSGCTLISLMQQNPHIQGVVLSMDSLPLCVSQGIDIYHVQKEGGGSLYRGLCHIVPDSGG